MFTALKEKGFEWAIILVLIGIVGIFIYSTLKTQDIMLVDKNARHVIQFCENNIRICEVGIKIYDANDVPAK